MQDDTPARFQFPFDITICGIEELPGHAERKVSHVLSIVDPDQPELEAFGTYGEHARLELRFHDIIEETPGEEAPQPHHVEQILSFGRDILREPAALRHLLVHCHAGVSRSTAAAAILMCQHAPGQEEAAFLKLLELRKHGWPNTRMVQFADTLLKRDGAMLRGLVAYRRALLDAKPHLSEIIRNIGRGHELPA
jgi:predicted protein tyrosine phosphatase